MLCLRVLRKVCSQSVRNISVGCPRNDFVRSSTLDKSEIDHHAQYADGWWDENGPFKALHSMNAVRIPLIRLGLVNTGRLKEEEIETHPDYLRGIKLLDVGCGGGILSIPPLRMYPKGYTAKEGPLARLGAEVTGLDPASGLIDVARKEAEARLPPESKINFVPSTIEEHEKENQGVYDVVVLSEVIEHITKKEDFIELCVNTLKPAGSIFFTTINRTMASWLGAIITAEYVLNLVPRGTHDWDKFVTPLELKTYLDKAGCKTLHYTGLSYQPFTNEWGWTPSPDILYALHAVKRL